ncbi:MAG: peptidoglycan DD-metalloendopeptidase family protein [Candidatus Vogelbacteria bacterium]|nr:peptidoglycan DD-metalloendopeptidase family protein [Candidatus Vogelbacteria bacterium]
MRQVWLKRVLAVGVMVLVAASARAATVEEIRSRINDHNVEIKKLETQIEAYQQELRAVAKTSKNLQNEIARLELTRQKLASDIKLTEQQIGKTDLTIEELTLAISDKDLTLKRRRAAVAESLRQWRKLQNQSLFELVLSYDRLSDAWTELSAFAAFDRQLKQDIDAVVELKTDLEATKTATETERARLAGLKERLADQRQIAKDNQTEKDRLLNQTKNKETNYKKLLAETVARKEDFEQELFQLESQLRITIDLGKLPVAGRGVLKWPLTNIFITQNFGQTVDAKRLYVSGSHNGIDLRAAVGTPVMAAEAGIVLGTGDTDLVCRGASYGKWVLIDHGNGLSTLYAHLSLIKVAKGQTVSVGEIIGYSGQTGYSTGPHLHLTVYATQGLRIDEYAFRSCAGAKVILPLADPGAYLDPMLYL